MTLSDIRSLRLFNEHLAGNVFNSPTDVVKWFGAVQSQDYHGAKWALAQRVKNATSESIDKLFNEGKILRTHIMRPTWHFVDPSDMRWLMDLTEPRVSSLFATYYRKEGLDEVLLQRTDILLAKALEGKNYLTRQELGKILNEDGINTKGLRLAFMVGHAELSKVVCSGPLKGKQFSYALFDERVPKGNSLTRDESLAEITKRYFTSHGPATVHDCAWWSGLTIADIQKGAAMNGSHLESETINGKTYWSGKTKKSAVEKMPLVHLLPNYDEYLISFKDYTPVQDPELKNKYANNVMFLGHIMTISGVVVGGWKRTFEKKSAVLTIKSLRPLTKTEKEALDKASEKFGKFLNMPVHLTFLQYS